MSSNIQFLSATPVLASLDIERTVGFFVDKLGFAAVDVQQCVYGIVMRGGVYIHFWACSDKRIAEATSCRVQVTCIRALHAHCQAQGIVHPRAQLEAKPWGMLEFSVLDPDGNLVTFHERAGA